MSTIRKHNMGLHVAQTKEGVVYILTLDFVAQKTYSRREDLMRDLRKHAKRATEEGLTNILDEADNGRAWNEIQIHLDDEGYRVLTNQ